MVIVVTGGGTGGHIFPNISVIEELRSRGEEEIAWIGSKDGKEREWAEKFHVVFHGIQAGKLRRYFSLKNIFDIFKVILGIIQSFFILLKLKPDALFSKGGFVSVPPVVAAWLLRVPIVTHESDRAPGLATKIISRFAAVVCVSFEKTGDSFSGKTVEYTGNPIRSVVLRGDQKRGCSFLDLKEALPVVLILGGSLGASSLNTAVREMCEKHDIHFDLVHQCGKGNLVAAPGGDTRYKQYEFIDQEIGDVLAASDLIVSRSGAGALFEIGYWKKPSILIPLPRSKSRGEQIENARYFGENGASLVINDEHLSPAFLYETINRVLSDRKKLKAMGEKAGELCRQFGEKAVCDVIESLLKKRKKL
jgi:UDP-N-acetylglucosamine--N-acetylmuramyl-(pentapeptide) pyrophosphoryl-undecaprenol N-acetylglucosamine transferase